MDSFGKTLKHCREAKKLSQQELSGIVGTSYTVIGKYEREEMKPSIEVVMNLAKAPGTSVSYLVGETSTVSPVQDTAMFKRLSDINALDEDEKQAVIFCLDAAIHFVKFKKIMQ